MKKKLLILGTRGIPAMHGGFETFTQDLSIHLTNKGWTVTVYCQKIGSGKIYEEVWNGIKLVQIPIKYDGTISTIIFDLMAVIDSIKRDGLVLTLGYNTAIFNILHMIMRRKNIINMDGIEWRRAKWGLIAKVWFWINERIGCLIGTHLVADHPKIKDHLSTRVSSQKISMIPYGAYYINGGDIGVIDEFGLARNKYSIIIARPEPENSILEIVSAFSDSKRGQLLVVLGEFDLNNKYHKSVIEAASEEVLFLGAIYDAEKVSALRYFSRYYLHGHQVGGTNPSLVEALGAGCAIIAHDNLFNKWVAADSAHYFKSSQDLSVFFNTDYLDDDIVCEKRRRSSDIFSARFEQSLILDKYEKLLTEFC